MRRLRRPRSHIKFLSSYDTEEIIVSKEEFKLDVDKFIEKCEEKQIMQLYDFQKIGFQNLESNEVCYDYILENDSQLFKNFDRGYLVNFHQLFNIHESNGDLFEYKDGFIIQK